MPENDPVRRTEASDRSEYAEKWLSLSSYGKGTGEDGDKSNLTARTLFQRKFRTFTQSCRQYGLSKTHLHKRRTFTLCFDFVWISQVQRIVKNKSNGNALSQVYCIALLPTAFHRLCDNNSSHTLRGVFIVARFDNPGDARAPQSGTSKMAGSTLFYALKQDRRLWSIMDIFGW